MINDYLVQWRTANHDNVATQLTHYKTNSFAIQNQASHVTKRTYRLLNVKRAPQSGLSLRLNLRCGANRGFEFHERRHLLIRVHNEALTVEPNSPKGSWLQRREFRFASVNKMDAKNACAT
jgi:hypothetical protein